MAGKRHRKRRLAVAIACCLPTLILASAWFVGASTSLLRPGRALPQRGAVGVEGHHFQVVMASGARKFEDLPLELRPPAGGGGAGPWGRQYTESETAAGLIGVKRGVEWHGTLATYFTLIAIPMWLPLLCTVPLLLVAAWQLWRVRAASRGRREGVCLNCGHDVRLAKSRCPECGRSLPSVDSVGQLFLAGGSTGGITTEARKGK